MREILYKAKLAGTGEWTGCICTCTKKNIYIACTFLFGGEPAISAQITEVNPKTICQYTGLTDKNGQKIWEGDICKIVSGCIDEEDGFFIVRWDNNGARFILESDSLLTDFDHIYGTECEVVGNIFDNPELMKGENE